MPQRSVTRTLMICLTLVLYMSGISVAAREPRRTDDAGTDARHHLYAEPIGQIGGRVNGIAYRNNRVYIGVGPRLLILDVSKPSDPVFLGQTRILPGIVEDVAIVGQDAYVAAGTGGLHVIDVSEPRTPSPVGLLEIPGEAQGISVIADVAYMAAGAHGLYLVDIRRPTAPQTIGSYDTPGSARHVAVSGAYAYVADGWQGLQIIDIADPAAPVHVGAYETPGDALDVTVLGTYVYLVDGESLRIIDISDPTALVGSGSVDTPGIARNVSVRGDYAYVADGGGRPARRGHL